MEVKHKHTAIANELVRKEYWNDDHDLDVASSGANIDDAVSKKHTQGTDTTLGNMTAAINMNTHQINGVVDPTLDQDAATKKYVDDSIPSAVGTVPIGGVVAWLKDFTNTPALPAQFVECNGQVLSDAESVYNGQTIPNLNGDNRFLRGNSTSGATGGESTHTLTVAEMPAHSHSFQAIEGEFIGGGGTVRRVITSFYSTGTSAVGGGNAHENKPPYYNVVWIMRIK